MAGEQVWRVPSLSLPDPHRPLSPRHVQDAEAVQLFVKRAQAVRPSFALTDQRVESVVQVCRRLDGIPLALELAAAQLSVLTLEGLAVRLDDCFRLLTGGSRTALPRHQTLRATLEWSWDLLSDAERTLLRRLAVFAGGFTLDAAELVCAGKGIEAGEVLALLRSLVNKSLVAGEEAGEAADRFGLLETVRRYALEHLIASGEEAAVRQRHLDWCLALAERTAPPLGLPGQEDWLHELERELDNLRAALRWAQEVGEGARGRRLAQVLGSFWDSTHHSEGFRWLHALLAAVPLLAEAASAEWTSTRAWALAQASRLAFMRTEPGTAKELAEQSLALFRALADPIGVAATLFTLGVMARDEGDFARSRGLLEESLALVSGLGDGSTARGYAASAAFQENVWSNLAITALQQGDLRRAASLVSEYGKNALGAWYTGRGRFIQAQVEVEQGDLARAVVLGEEALALSQQVGDRRNLALTLGYLLGPVRREQGDLELAIALGEESLTLGRELQDGGVIGWACLGLGQAACEQGDPVRAQAALAEGLRLFQARGMRWFMARCLAGLTQVACLQGEMQRATQLVGATEALLHSMDAPLPRGDRSGYGRVVDAARAALGDDAFTAAWRAGQALPLEEAAALALADNPAC